MGEHHFPTRLQQWLATGIDEAAPLTPLPADTGLPQLVAATRREGIAALLHARLCRIPDMPEPPQDARDAIAELAREQAALSLYQQNCCRRILERFAQADLPVLVLKGMALAFSAYAAPHLRQCADIDLLVRSRTDADRAIALLAELGHAPTSPILPGDLISFELTCVPEDSASPALEIDLHWHLSSTPMFAFRLNWQELDAAAIALPGLAPNARGLTPVHAWLHACMHRIQDRACGGSDRLKWLFDLIVLGRRFSASDWNSLAKLAVERELAGVCLDGSAAAEAFFGPLLPHPVRAKLSTAAISEPMDLTRMDRWWYVQRMSLAAYKRPLQKLRWLRQRLLPNRAYLRQRYGTDTGLGRALLMRLRAALKR